MSSAPLNNLSVGNKFISKIQGVNVKNLDSDEAGHHKPSHLDEHCLQKPLIITRNIERVKTDIKCYYT